METNLQEVRNQLLATDEAFSRLAREHSDYEQQLEELSQRPHLTEDERLLEIKLKKKKLSLKDQMEQILQQHRQPGQDAVAL